MAIGTVIMAVIAGIACGLQWLNGWLSNEVKLILVAVICLPWLAWVLGNLGLAMREVYQAEKAWRRAIELTKRFKK